MEFRYKSFSISRIFLIAFLISHIVLYFIGNEKAFELFALNPKLVIFDIQVWRLFTFPLVSLSIAEAFLFAYTFWVLGPRVENCFRKNYYLFSLFIFVFLQGFFTTALFGKENFYLVGTEGLSFYLITLYFLIYFRIVGQYETLPFRSMVQTAFVIFFWLMAAMLDSYIYERNILVNSFSFALGGIFMGSLAYLQNRSFALELLQQRYRDFVSFRKKLEEFESEDDIDDFVPKSNLNEHLSSTSANKEEPRVNLPYTEETLNHILDKIIEKGKESLSPEEIRFLKEYSKKLNKKGD